MPKNEKPGTHRINPSTPVVQDLAWTIANVAFSLSCSMCTHFVCLIQWYFIRGGEGGGWKGIFGKETQKWYVILFFFMFESRILVNDATVANESVAFLQRV